jgi:hypothetical protein
MSCSECGLAYLWSMIHPGWGQFAGGMLCKALQLYQCHPISAAAHCQGPWLPYKLVL